MVHPSLRTPAPARLTAKTQAAAPNDTPTPHIAPLPPLTNTNPNSTASFIHRQTPPATIPARAHSQLQIGSHPHPWLYHPLLLHSLRSVLRFYTLHNFSIDFRYWQVSTTVDTVPLAGAPPLLRCGGYRSWRAGSPPA